MKTIDLPQPDRRIDAAIHQKYCSFVLDIQSGPISNGQPVPSYCTSMDAALFLLAKTLPNWLWSIRNHKSRILVHVFPTDRINDADNKAPLEQGLELAFTKQPTARRMPGALELITVTLALTEAIEKDSQPNENDVLAFYEHAITSRLHPYGVVKKAPAPKRQSSKTKTPN